MKAQPLLVRYQTLRKAIGFTGLSFPFVLGLGGMALGIELQDSISHYYHTALRDVFVGVLCSISVFFFTYRGYDLQDRLVGGVAAVSAIVVALFPTHASDAAKDWVGYVHYAAAIVLFGCFIYYAVFLFTKSDQPNPGEMKKRRNRLYQSSGAVMAMGVLFAGSAIAFDLGFIPNAVFWGEAVALVAFGFSWLEKGAALAAMPGRLPQAFGFGD